MSDTRLPSGRKPREFSRLRLVFRLQLGSQLEPGDLKDGSED